MDLQHRSIHGQNIAFRFGGSGPALVLIHGMAGSSQTWEAVLPALARRFTVLAPDLLGHGESAKPRADYSLGAYAAGVRDLMAALDLGRATMIGQSFGGGVVMQLAYQHPELCERLVLVGSGGLGSEVNPLLRALSLPGGELLLAACRPRARDVAARAVAGLQRLGWRPSPAQVEIGRSYASLADADARYALVHTLRSVIDRFGQRVSARDRFYLASAIPKLVVWGEDDPVIPVEHAYDAHRELRGSRLEIFPGAGHFPHCEDPERFVSVVTRFIGDTAPAELTQEHLRALLRHHAA